MTNTSPTILEKILAEKKLEVAERSQKTPLELLENIIVEQNDTPRGFYGAMIRHLEANKHTVIGEIKKASPVNGLLCANFDPVALAKSYETAGVTCLSVVTDEKFFQGCESHLDAVREASQLPVLRKDFIIDAYQVFESRVMGADCILLIADFLEREQIYSLTRLAYDLGMDVLVEVHDVEDLDKVAGLPIRMISINNRNLHTFEVNLNATFDLALMIPDEILVVTEGGISEAKDILLLNTAGIKAFLVGESVIAHHNPEEKIKELFSW